MSRYRKIDPRIWNDAKFRGLSDDGKLAFLFVLTHPHMTALGAMRATLDGLAAEIGWASRRFKAALAPAIDGDMIDHDPAAAYLGLPRFLRYNEPEGPNSVKAWMGALPFIPECEGRRRLLESCLAYLDGRSPEFRKAIGDAIVDAIRDAIGMPCHIYEQEHEQDLTTAGQAGQAAPVEGKQPARRSPSVPDGFLEAMELFPKRAGDNPKPRAVKAWNARVAEGHSTEELTAGVRRYAAFIRATGKESSEFVKQAASFFGPDKAFLEPWTAPEPRIAAAGTGAAW